MYTSTYKKQSPGVAVGGQRQVPCREQMRIIYVAQKANMGINSQTGGRIGEHISSRDYMGRPVMSSVSRITPGTAETPSAHHNPLPMGSGGKMTPNIQHRQAPIISTGGGNIQGGTSLAPNFKTFQGSSTAGGAGALGAGGVGGAGGGSGVRPTLPLIQNSLSGIASSSDKGGGGIANSSSILKGNGQGGTTVCKTRESRDHTGVSGGINPSNPGGLTLETDHAHTHSVPPLPADPPMQGTMLGGGLSITHDLITIHVFDESRQVKQDFVCDRVLLQNKMKYFQQYVEGNTSLEDLDISVHCDIHIFEWLMKYLKSPSPDHKLEITNVVSILISADFLQMSELVEESVKFIADRLLEVIKLPIDMTCINSRVLRKIARYAQIEELDDYKDRRDKLISKLYMKKLEVLFDDESHALMGCVYCNKLFTRAQKEWMVCPKAELFIDFHGNVIAQHVEDRTWDMNKFILCLRQGGLSWREIYWKIRALLITFRCLKCDSLFVGNEVEHCSYHPQGATFAYGSNEGVYTCCNANALRFDTSIKKTGCCATQHTIETINISTLREYEKIIERRHIISEPFISEHKFEEEFQNLLMNYQKKRGSLPNAKNVTDILPIKKITDSPPLMVMMHNFRVLHPPALESGDEEEEDSLGEEEMAILEENKKGEEKGGGKRKQKNAAKYSPSNNSTPKAKTRVVDNLRIDDRQEMNNLTKQLSKLRENEKYGRRQGGYNTNNNAGNQGKKAPAKRVGGVSNRPDSRAKSETPTQGGGRPMLTSNNAAAKRNNYPNRYNKPKQATHFAKK